MKDLNNDIKITALHPEHVAATWPLLKPAFDSFAERTPGAQRPVDYLRDVLNLKRQCWVAYVEGVRAVALTEVTQGHEQSVTLTHCWGKGREDWQDEIVDEIENWAASRGAVRLVVVCRPGWTKFLKGRGMKETHRVLEKNIGTV